MNLPTTHQVAVAASIAGASAASVIATLGVVHLLNPADVNNATAAISQISNGVAQIMTGVGVLGTIGVGVYNTIKSSPIISLLRASKTIAASPALTEQVKAASIADKAPLVAITDHMPEVAGVGTTRTPEGNALARAVPSQTVQPVAAVSQIGKAV